MNAVVLVGRRADGGARDTTWGWVSAFWHQALGWRISEGYHDDGPFNLAAATNAAAKGDWDVALLIGADTLMTSPENVLEAAAALAGASAVTFGPYYEQDENSFSADEPVSPSAGTAAMLVTRELWDRVGGFDERFVGWGWEDIAFVEACATLGDVTHLTSPVIHVYHERDPERGAHAFIDANLRLGQRYIDARGNPDAMRLILDERRRPSGGVVAVTADEAGRYTRFAISMQGLQIPAGSRTLWQIGNDIAGNRNGACEQLLADGGDWLWFVDDDHAFAPDVLQRLLARDVDVVTPICLRRVQPFLTVPCVDGDFLDLSRYGPDELVEVEHAGSSGMLIRRRVLEQVEPPWFELGNGISEDVNFCRKARAAGFDVHVDLACRLGHITTAVVWPSWDGERWLTGFDVADGAQLAIEPAAVAAV